MRPFESAGTIRPGWLSGMFLLAVFALVLLVWSRAHRDDAGALRTQWPRTDFSRHTVPLEEIISGGPPKDGIPAIDAPRFVAFAVADASGCIRRSRSSRWKSTATRGRTPCRY